MAGAAAGLGAGAAPAVYRVYSNNTQGAGNVGFVAGEIRRSDVVMLQESGAPGFLSALAAPNADGLRIGQVQFGTRHNPDIFNVVHLPNGRCSQTVMVRSTLGPVGPTGLVLAPGGMAGGLRPMVRVEVNGTILASVHAPSGHPAAATGVVNTQLGILDATGQDYLVAGDFNSPASSQTTGFRTGHMPDRATHQGGGCLDGAVCSATLAGGVQNAANRGSDHFGIRGQFQ